MSGAEIAIAGAAAAGANVIALIRAAADKLKATGKSEVIGELIEAQLAMMDLLQKHQSLIDENHQLRVELRQVRELLESRQNLECFHDAYWFREGNRLEGPFSMRTWDNDKKLARMECLRRERFEDGEKLVFTYRPNNEMAYVPVNFATKNNLRQLNERTNVIDR